MSAEELKEYEDTWTRLFDEYNEANKAYKAVEHLYSSNLDSDANTYLSAEDKNKHAKYAL